MPRCRFGVIAFFAPYGPEAPVHFALHTQSDGHPAAVSLNNSRTIPQVAANVVAATLDIYNTIADNLLPTPAKSHYTFNLRDLSKVFQVKIFRVRST